MCKFEEGRKKKEVEHDVDLCVNFSYSLHQLGSLSHREQRKTWKKPLGVTALTRVESVRKVMLLCFTALAGISSEDGYREEEEGREKYL